MTSPRVVLVTRYRAVLGGAQQYLRTLIPCLRQRGHEVALVVEEDALSNRLDDSVDVPVWDAATLGRHGVIRAVASWRPDVVYQHGLRDVDLEAALLETHPAVLFAHSYYGTCISGSKRHALPAAVPCRRVLGPGCLWRYLPRRCGGLDPVTALRDYALQRRRLALVRRYRAVVVASRAMRQEYLRHGLPEDRVVSVPLFADVDRDVAPPAARPPGGRLLMVGRLTEIKGGRELLRAVPMARLALRGPLELTVAGEGPDRERLERDSRRLGVGARFVGWVDREQRTRLMREADLLALPSTWPEPFGLVGLEAAAVGLPAVAFGVGGIPEWCEPGVTGEIAPSPPTPRGLAEAIARALGDANRHARLRRGAWEAAGRFSAGAHVGAVSRLLAEAAR